MSSNRSRITNSRLLRWHAAVGIMLSLLMYLSLYFGLFAIFKPFIEVWEKPSRHFPVVDVSYIDYEPMLAEVLTDPDFPKSNILIDLPGFYEDPALAIYHQFTPKNVFNPATGEKLKDEGRQTSLAMFLNGMHYGRPLMKAGLTVFGLMAAGSLFLIVGGLFLVYRIRFKSTGKTVRGRYSLWHRRLLTWTSPFFLLIVLCASVMGISFDGAGLLTSIVTKGEKNDIRPIIGPVLFPEAKPVTPANHSATMLPIRDLVKRAAEMEPVVRLQRLTLINWGDPTARIKIEGFDPRRPFLNGVTNRPTIILDARDGSLIEHRRVGDRPWSVLLTEGVYFIHLLFGVGILLRTLVFLAMAACWVAIFFGVMLWLEKKKKPFKGKAPFYHWMDKLSLAVMIGVIPATGVLFTLQWLLPFDLENRLVWQQGAFFNCWLATFCWSFHEIDSKAAARKFLSVGGALFMCASVLHGLKTGFGPQALIQGGLTNIFAVDAGLFIFGLLFLGISRRLPVKNKETARFPAPKQKKRYGNV